MAANKEEGPALYHRALKEKKLYVSYAGIVSKMLVRSQGRGGKTRPYLN